MTITISSRSPFFKINWLAPQHQKQQLHKPEPVQKLRSEKTRLPMEMVSEEDLDKIADSFHFDF
jgi:hypothetical protein